MCALTTYTVAVADDHAYMRRALIVTIGSFGYDVIVEAKNGRDLVAKLDDNCLPSICVVDMRMPEMDGLETIRYLKARWPCIKILVYSMNDDGVSKDKALAYGADAYLVKGSGLQELHGQLASLAARRSCYTSSLIDS